MWFYLARRQQDALSNLEMARFTRRYPVVLEMVMKQMMALVKARMGRRMGEGGAWRARMRRCMDAPSTRLPLAKPRRMRPPRPRTAV